MQQPPTDQDWSPPTVSSTPGASAAPPAAAPSTPPWLLGRDLPETVSGCPTCPVCHRDVRPGASGPEATFAWPQCGHALHLGCAAHVVVNVSPLALACPSCRASWPASAADLLLDACRVHSVPIPAPAPDHDTTSDLHRAAIAPPPPAHILPLCFPRVYLANPRAAASEGAWEELPGRHMHWAPVHNRQSGEWRAEWACLRCNTTVDESHPLLAAIPQRPLCTLHGPRALALDLREQSLVTALQALQQVAVADGRRLPPAEIALLTSLAQETACLPPSARAHFLWAWQRLTLPEGYIPATAQECLLHVFLGEREASALVQAISAQAVPNQPPAQPTAPDAGSSSTSSS